LSGWKVEKADALLKDFEVLPHDLTLNAQQFLFLGGEGWKNGTEADEIGELLGFGFEFVALVDDALLVRRDWGGGVHGVSGWKFGGEAGADCHEVFPVCGGEVDGGHKHRVFMFQCLQFAVK
jgi:hypothetical protein